MRTRVEAEARAAAQVIHPNVVTVFDSGVDGDHPFIVMELLDGRSLDDELERGPDDPSRPSPRWPVRCSRDSAPRTVSA